MAYCDKCGAYIPDGQTKCLACGYDEAEERAAQAAASASASASAASADTGKYYGFSNDELRAKLEEQRKKQQEQSRVWAEQERERRQREQDRAQRERERMQHEREQQRRREEEQTSTARSTGARSVNTIPSLGEGESKVLAALSYVSILFLLPYFLRRDDSFAMYHARQGLVLLIYGVLADILGTIPVIGWIFGLFRIYCVFKGISNAVKGVKEPLPYIGKYAERR